MKNDKQQTMGTVRIKLSTVKRLNLWKYELNCKTVDELIDRILKIVPASELTYLNHSKEKI